MSARLIGRISAEPWLIAEPALRTILEIAAREEASPDTLAAWKHGGAQDHRIGAVGATPRDRLPGAQMAGTAIAAGVAILPVTGPIFRYANLFTDLSGAVALSAFAADLELARADSRVRAIVLELDTPGGEAQGIAEAARQIRRAAAEKPVVAYVDGTAASAGYWLGAAAGELVIASTGLVGCLGAVCVVEDARPAREARGVRRVEIVSSQTPNKRPDPFTSEGRARWQALLDRLAAEFLGDAAAFRGMTVAELLAATDGGDLVMGADAAERGLADRVGDFETVLADLAGGGGWLAPAATIPRKGKNMPSVTMSAAEAAAERQAAEFLGAAAAAAAAQDPPPPAPQAEAEPPAPETPAEDPPAPETPAEDAPAAAGAEDITLRVGVALEGAADALAERARAVAVVNAFAAGTTLPHAWLLTMALAEGWPADRFAAALAAARAETDAAAEAARAAAAAEARQAGAAAFAGAFPPPVRTAGDAPELDAPAAGTPEALEAEAQRRWNGDASLRAEFGGRFGSFLAFHKAEKAGRVKRLEPRRQA